MNDKIREYVMVETQRYLLEIINEVQTDLLNDVDMLMDNVSVAEFPQALKDLVEQTTELSYKYFRNSLDEHVDSYMLGLDKIMTEDAILEQMARNEQIHIAHGYANLIEQYVRLVYKMDQTMWAIKHSGIQYINDVVFPEWQSNKEWRISWSERGRNVDR